MTLHWIVSPLPFVPRTVIQVTGPPLKAACVSACMFHWSRAAVRSTARPRLGFLIVSSPLEDTVDLFLEKRHLRPARCTRKHLHSPSFRGFFYIFYLCHSVRGIRFHLFERSGLLPLHLAALYFDVQKNRNVVNVNFSSGASQKRGLYRSAWRYLGSRNQ